MHNSVYNSEQIVLKEEEEEEEKKKYRANEENLKCVVKNL